MSSANVSSTVCNTLAYFAALPGKIDSDATAPSTPTTATSTGRHDAHLKAFALPSFGSTLPVPFL